MSRKFPVRSLSDIALAEVAGSIVGAIGSMLQTTYNFGVEPDFTILMVEIKSYMETMGATSAIYEDLLRVILCSDSLEAVIRFCCLQTLLNEAVHTLMTEIFPFAYYERILQVIATQGRGLRQLNMKGVWVKEEFMCFMYEIIKHLPHLTKLTIPHIANDNLLKHISDYCKNLRHLDISGNTDVTDIGLEYLSYGESKNNLTVLDIGSLGEENVCHTDIAMLLMNLPNLVSLVSYSFVGRSLQYILENKDPAFRCKLVYLHDTGTKAKTIQAIIDTCPNLQDLYIDSPEPNTLTKLSKVNLRRLKLYKFCCSELLTLLESIGNYMRHLTVIKGRGTMEIHRLIRCCPNLVDLDFYMMDSLSFSGDHGFLDLQGLEILSSPISQPGLRNLLSLSTTLKRLAIDSVTFNDEDFCALMIEKDFYQLEDVWFTTAPYLSITSVEILMDRCPELQSLGQLSGWSLTPDDVTLLRGILKSCNSALTGSTKDRVKSGQPRSARTPAAIKVVRERIRRKMNRSIRKTAADLNVSIRTAHNIMTKDLGYKPYKKRKVHGVTEATTKKRLDRSKLILSRHAGQEFVFSDEKLFVLQLPHNVQNDRLWAPTLASIPPSDINIPRFQSATTVMVWGAVSRRGKLPLVFIEKNVKINAAYYKTEVLEKVVAPALRDLYGKDHYVFQQDGAPAHTANIVQAWCQENLTDFLDKTLWPPSSPDLNPLDFYVWSYMLAKQSEHQVSTMDQFKKLISKIWDEMPMDQVRAACDSFEKRLKLVVKHKGRVLPANMS